MVRLNALTRKLTRIGGITLSIVAYFPSDKIVLGTKYNPDTSTKNISIDFPSFIRFEAPYTVDTKIKRYINLTYIGKLQMSSAMKTMMKKLATNEVFVNDTELGLMVTKDLKEDGTSKWAVTEKIGSGIVGMIPAVITEETAVYEGVTIFINSTDNRVSMTTSEFIALKTFLDQIDLWGLSQILFNTAITMEGLGVFDRDPSIQGNLLGDKLFQLEENLQPRRATNVQRKNE